MKPAEKFRLLARQVDEIADQAERFGNPDTYRRGMGAGYRWAAKIVADESLWGLPHQYLGDILARYRFYRKLAAQEFTGSFDPLEVGDALSDLMDALELYAEKRDDRDPQSGA